MSAAGPQCPCCGSVHIASRRQLFHWLMEDVPLMGGFAWYSERSPRACPPKSLFVILAMLMLGMLLPAAGLWLLGHYLALRWLAVISLVLLGALLFDVLMTYRRYKTWGGEWLCSECRFAFRLATV